MSIGIHCDKFEKTFIGSLTKYFEECPKSNCVQIFTHGPRNSNRIKWLDTDLEKFLDLTKHKNVYVHQTYTTSWKPEGLKHMQDQIDVATQIGAKGVVLHLGKISPEDHLFVLKKLNLTVPVILEMRALKPDKYSYQSTEEINQLCKIIRQEKINATICIDTAHLSAGKIRLDNIESAKSYFDKLSDPDLISLLHLNGNEYDPNVRAGDKHCVPMSKKDFVFTNMDSIQYIVNWFIQSGKDVILEQDYTDELKSLLVKF